MTPEFSSFRQKKFISYVLWVRNLGVVCLGPLAQSLSQGGRQGVYQYCKSAQASNSFLWLVAGLRSLDLLDWGSLSYPWRQLKTWLLPSIWARKRKSEKEWAWWLLDSFCKPNIGMIFHHGCYILFRREVSHLSPVLTQGKEITHGRWNSTGDTLIFKWVVPWLSWYTTPMLVTCIFLDAPNSHGNLFIFKFYIHLFSYGKQQEQLTTLKSKESLCAWWHATGLLIISNQGAF